MDDNRFDSLTRLLASGVSRRSLLKGLLGIGGVTAAGSVLNEDADAAQRPMRLPRRTLTMRAGFRPRLLQRSARAAWQSNVFHLL